MKKFILAVATVLSLLAISTAPVAALDLFPTCTSSSTDPACALKDNSLQQGNSNFAVKNLINTALYVLAGICVLMIVIGGLRIAISNGEASAITSGKMTILYAVIGLVVAILAYAIVNFVVAHALK
jgi:hypothetical protein